MKSIVQALFIYVKSLIDFLLLIFFRILESKNIPSNNILFINTGNIGDLVITGPLLDTNIFLTNFGKVFLLINKEHIRLFDDYQGKFEIFPINVDKYKYNYLYRVKIILKLRKMNFTSVYNLTSVRATWNDSLALCIGAFETFSFNNTWKSLKKVFPKRTDKFYTNQIGNNIFNEYLRIEHLFKKFSNNKVLPEKFNLFVKKKVLQDYEIVIAPFSSDKKRDWPLINYIQIVNNFKGRKILVVCSKSQAKNFNKYNIHQFVTFSFNEYKLSELHSIINRSKVFLGLDSGITHIALTTGVNIIAIIGLGNFGRYLPKPGDSKTKYLFEDCEYKGCEWNCKMNEPICIRKVSVKSVIKEIEKILQHENS